MRPFAAYLLARIAGSSKGAWKAGGNSNRLVGCLLATGVATTQQFAVAASNSKQQHTTAANMKAEEMCEELLTVSVSRQAVQVTWSGNAKPDASLALLPSIQTS